MNSEIQKRAINLGKRIVQELELEPGIDTLSKWMAHYISEQIAIAENATGEESAKAKQKCYDTILKLWERRAQMPDGNRPLEEFEHIFDVLKKIDPENNKRSFYQPKDFAKVKEEEDIVSEVEFWTDKVESINDATRMLLRFCLGQAFENAKNQNVQKWLKNSIGSVPTYDLQSVNTLKRVYEEFNEQETDDNEEDRRLKALLKDCGVILENIQELQKELKAKIENDE